MGSVACERVVGGAARQGGGPRPHLVRVHTQQQRALRQQRTVVLRCESERVHGVRVHAVGEPP